MTKVASWDLRNHPADVLQAVAAGSRVTVTVHGRPVAEIGPVPGTRRTSMARADLVRVLAEHQADPGLRADLAALGGPGR